MYNTNVLAKTSLEVLPRGRHRPFLKSEEVNVSSAQLPFLALPEVKCPPGLARCVGSGEKTLQVAKLLFYRVHSEIVQKHMK